MKITKFTFRILTYVFAFTFLLSSFAPSINYIKAAEVNIETVAVNEISNYSKYKNIHSDKAVGKDEISLSAVDFSSKLSLETNLKSDSEEDGLIVAEVSENGSISFEFTIENAGLYSVAIEYLTYKEDKLTAECEMLLDGKKPFDNIPTIELTPVFKTDNELKEDLQGNQIRPDVFRYDCCQALTLSDIGGYTEEDYAFYLESGVHTITFASVTGELKIKSVNIFPAKTNLTYAEYIKNQDSTDVEDIFKKLQAENYSFKSHESILTQNDRSSAMTEPNSSYKVVYNSLGGSSWSDCGQWIEWEIDVPKNGYYNIGSRWRQNTKIGGVSSRILTIDGKLPFEESSNLSFSYSNSWQVSTFGDKEPYSFYLTKGKHKLRLTVNYGEMAEIYSCVESIVNELNGIYLDIIMITGATPDLKRDYNFKAQIPNTIEKFSFVSKEIEDTVSKIKKITGGKQKISEINRVLDTLKLMYEDPELIAKRLSSFQANISALATWLSESRKQPLELDYIFLFAGKSALPKANSGFFTSLAFQFKQLLGSYVMDYTTIGNTSEKSDEKNAITVWMTYGTEQAGIVQKMTNEEFIPKTGISVKAQNVALGALMPALLAGRGPDVMLNMDEATPVNYALRGAVYDLNKFKDINEILGRFDECTYDSFKVNDGIYALPLTVDYPVLFYRTDIIKQLDIKEEDFNSWDNILQVVLPKIQTKNLYFGLMPSFNSFLMFYYQSGGELYEKDTDRILLDSKKAVNSFTKYSSIYSDYKQKLSFSFVNLFRSGEMPIAVMSYSQYFQLAVFAPEIDNLWQILPVPGTDNSDGLLNRSTACTVTGASIMASTKSPEKSWEFLKWWTDSSAQINYASQAETILGIAGRVNTANNTARETIAWPNTAKRVLDAQLSYCKGVQQVPGSYYAARYFDFAFRDVVYSNEDIVQSLSSAANDINAEISEKKQELQ